MKPKLLFLIIFFLALFGCRTPDTVNDSDAISIDNVNATVNDSGAISIDNVNALVEVARYGSETVYDLVYSHDGSRLLLATSIGVQVLDAVTLEERGMIGTDTFVTELALSADGRFLATVSGGTVTMWQLGGNDATELYTMADIRAIAFHPATGELWVVEGGDPDSGPTTISRHQTENGNVLERQNIDVSHWIRDFAIAPVNGLIAGSFWDDDFNGDVLLWNASTGEEKHLLENHQNGISSLSFSPDEQFLASASGQFTLFDDVENRITLWNVADGRKLNTYNHHRSNISALAFDPESEHIVSGDDEGRILWWDRNREDPVYSDAGFNMRVMRLAFSPDGSQLAAVSLDGSIRVFTAFDERLAISRERNGSGVTGLGMATEAEQFATSHRDGTVRIWQIGEDEPVAILDKGRIDYQRMTVRESVKSVAISPDARHIMAYEWVRIGSGRGFLLWKQGEASSLIVRRASLGGAAFSGDNQTFVVLTAKFDNTAMVEIWHTNDLTPTLQIEEEYEHETRFILLPLDIAISVDGTMLAYGLHTGNIQVRNIENGEIVHSFTDSTEPVTAVAFSPDGKQLLSATDTGTLTLWNLEDGSKLAATRNDENRWRDISFSPNGLLIAAASHQGMVVFYTVMDLNEVARLTAHSHEISGLAFVEEGTVLLTSSLDGTVRAWSIEH